VPAELLPELPDEERDFIMATREWYEPWSARRLEEAEKRGIERGQLQMTVRLCAKRLARPLVEAEHVALASRLDRLGEDRVGEVVLSFSADASAISGSRSLSISVNGR
jgi:hypothetical protein